LNTKDTKDTKVDRENWLFLCVLGVLGVEEVLDQL
jgi:hypothetical protein